MENAQQLFMVAPAPAQEPFEFLEETHIFLVIRHLLQSSTLQNGFECKPAVRRVYALSVEGKGDAAMSTTSSFGDARR